MSRARTFSALRRRLRPMLSHRAVNGIGTGSRNIPVSTRCRRLWVGSTLSVLAITTWALSVPLHFGYARGRTFVGFWQGCLRVSHYLADGTWSTRSPSGWSIGIAPPACTWWPEVFEEADYHGTFVNVGFPLWMPFLVVTLPTLVAWRRYVRAIPPGHCPHCDYNLTGNVSGVCPECGEKV